MDNDKPSIQKNLFNVWHGYIGNVKVKDFYPNFWDDPEKEANIWYINEIKKYYNKKVNN